MKFSRLNLLTVILIIVMIGITTYASGTPKLISYQGKATTSAGAPVSDGVHDVWFFLYTNSSGASYIWSDNASIQTEGGLLSYNLGSNPSSPLPDSIFVQRDSLFLGIVLDGETLTPLTPLTSAPYALRVNSIGGAKGGVIDGSIQFIDTTNGLTYATIREDGSGGGAGYFSIGGQYGLAFPALHVDGDYNGSGTPYVTITGQESSASFWMGATGNRSVRLPNNAIHSLEMANEAGVGSYINQEGYGVTSGVTYLGSRAMFAPSDGYVLVIASAEVSVYHSLYSNEQFYFGVSDDCTNLYESTKILLRVDNNLPSGQLYYPITVHGLFPVDSGTTTFCFLSERVSGTCKVENITISELFVPTAYTTVIEPSVQTSPGEAEAERASELSFHEARMQAELDKITEQIEQIKKQLDSKRK